MMITALITATIWGLFRGLREGIVMYQPGPRVHPWFCWYHAVETLEIVSLILCTLLFYKYTNPLYLASAALLSWESFELAYAWGRRGQAANHENVFGIFAVNGDAVTVIHLARVLIGIGLLIGGML